MAGGGTENRMVHHFELRLIHDVFRASWRAAKGAVEDFAAGAKQAMTGTNAEMEKAKSVQAAALTKMRAELDQTKAAHEKQITVVQGLVQEEQRLQARLTEVAAEANAYVAVLDRMEARVIALTASQEKLKASMATPEGRAAAGGAEAIQAEYLANQRQIEQLQKSIALKALDGSATAEDTQKNEKFIATMLAEAAAISAVNDKITTAVAKEKELGAAAEESASKVATAESTAAGGGGLGARLGGLTGMFGALLTAIPLVGAALGGLIAITDHMAVSTAKYASDVLSETQNLGMATTAGRQYYQMIVAGAEQLGISHQRVTTALLGFQKSIQHLSSEDLKQYGISLKDANGNVVDTTGALQQYMTWLTKVSTAEGDAATQTLFRGRAVADLNRVLRSDAGDRQKFIADLASMGVILNDDQLKADAFGAAIHAQMTMQIQGASRAISTSLMTSFSLLWAMIGKGVQNSVGFITTLTSYAIKVGIFLMAFFDALMGKEFKLAETLKDLHTRLQGLGESTAKTADSQKKLADAHETAKQKAADQKVAADNLRVSVDKLRDSTADQTQAIDDQIEAIRNAPSAIQAKIDALNDENGATQKLIESIKLQADAQIKAKETFLAGEEAKLKLYDLEQQRLDALHSTELARDRDALDSLKDVTESQRKSGESYYQYRIRLEEKALSDKIKKDEETRAVTKTTAEVQIEQLRQSTKAETDALALQRDTAIRNIEDRRKAELAALKEEKDAEDATRKSEIKGLEDRKKALQRNLTAMERANALTQANIQADNAKTLDSSLDEQNKEVIAAQLSADDITKIMADMTKNLDVTGTKGFADAGSDWGTSLRDAFMGGKSGEEDPWVKLGKKIGSAILDGMASELGHVALFGQDTQGMLPRPDWHGEYERNQDGSINPKWQEDERLKKKWHDSGNKGDPPNGYGTRAEADKRWHDNGNAGPAPPGYAEGGMHFSPRMISVGEGYKPEVTIPLTKPNNARALMERSGLSGMASEIPGYIFNTTFTGPVATDLVGSRVVSRIAADMRRHRLPHRRGIG